MRYVKKQTGAQDNRLSSPTKQLAREARVVCSLLLATCALLMHVTASAVTLSKQADEFNRYYLVNQKA